MEALQKLTEQISDTDEQLYENACKEAKEIALNAEKDAQEQQKKQPPHTIIEQISEAKIDHLVLQFEGELQDQIADLKKQHAQEVANLQQAISLVVAQMNLAKKFSRKNSRLPTKPFKSTRKN